MLERFITEKLDNWLKNSKNIAFVVDGARQVGKTYLLNWFCKKNFESFLSINLSTDYESFNIIKKASSVSDYLNYFNLISKNTLIAGKSVVYIDEVQLFPRLITDIKFLVQDGTYRYILSGSLIGFALRITTLIPVGYCDIHMMYPLTFKEFLLANGVSKSILDSVETSLRELTPIQDGYFLYFEKLFKIYLLTGGMPEVVASYLENEDYTRVLEIQKRIISLYKEDIAKYQEESKYPLLMRMYNKIPYQLLKTFNRFYLNQLKENCRYSEIESTLSWLIISGVTCKVELCNDLSDGLVLSDPEKFKLYLNDVGLLSANYDESYKFQFIGDSKTINLGPIYENFVCQELTSKDKPLHYFNNKLHGEIEFICYDNTIKSIVPIEVKSGSSYKTHKSLNYALDTYNNIKRAYVLCKSNIQVEGKIVYLPVWSIGLIPGVDSKDYPPLKIPKLEE